MSEEDAKKPERPQSGLYITGGATDETVTPPTGKLALVSDFAPSSYIYSFTQAFNDPLDGFERHNKVKSFQTAAFRAHLKDYKIFDTHAGVEIYMKTPEDIQRFKIATSPGSEVQHEVVQFEKDYDYRKIKRICAHLNKLAVKNGFDDIVFGEIRSEKAIMLFAEDKNRYFDFIDFFETTDILEKLKTLQRKEPEFDIPMPTEEEATATPVTYVNEDEYDDQDAEVQQETNPKSMGITIGGKAQDTERSTDRSHLSLAKSFEPNANGYIFKLTPKIMIDPSRSQMDKLCMYDPGYPDFKFKSKTETLMNQIRAAILNAEVDDYHLSDENGVQAWFKRPEDLAVAYAAISPDMGYQVDFLSFSQNASPMKMNKKAKQLQRIFAEANPKVDVRFVVDKDRHVIQAVTPNTDDFIKVQGISRRLERSHDKFQRIVGLDIQ